MHATFSAHLILLDLMSQMIKLPIMELSTFPCNFLSLRPKCSAGPLSKAVFLCV